jgi:hypothetical protein
MASCVFVKTTFLSRLYYNTIGHKNLTLFMPCRKKVHSISSFLLATFGLIFLKKKPTSGDFSILAIHEL